MTALEQKELPGAEKISVSIPGSGVFDMPKGSKAVEALRYDTTDRRSSVVAVRINNALESLRTELTEDCTLEFIDLESEEGNRIYQNGLIIVLCRATCEVLPGCRITIKHSLSNALYGEIEGCKNLKISDFEKIERTMRAIVNGGGTFERRLATREEAEEIFRRKGQTDRLNLLKYWDFSIPPNLYLIKSGEYLNYTFDPVIPDLSILKSFRLRYYMPGFILEMPRKEDPFSLPIYVEQGKLSTVLFEADKWGDILHVHDMVSLNRIIKDGRAGDLIRVAEAFQEKRISAIADRIASNIGRVRIVLVAGPSSSGKTTFTQRLSIQLRVNGINPVAISMDDYFREREETPKNEKGEYDFEHINAIDRPLFNEHLIKLIQGEEIELPAYNFKTGMREYSGKKLKLGPNDLIITEGIHGLNDQLTSAIPKGRKYKIYVSALTNLSLDRLNRIRNTDLRVIRRIVRDNNFRGNKCLQTLERWPMVVKGEEKNIFPFQEAADVMFNSALVYELSVLKVHAEPLLREVTREYPQYAEAQRLLKILSFFAPLESTDIPLNSLLREFIGQGCFM